MKSKIMDLTEEDIKKACIEYASKFLHRLDGDCELFVDVPTCRQEDICIRAEVYQIGKGKDK